MLNYQRVMFRTSVGLWMIFACGISSTSDGKFRIGKMTNMFLSNPAGKLRAIALNLAEHYSN